MAAIEPWDAVCIQVPATVVTGAMGRDEARHNMATKLEHIEILVTKVASDSKVKLLLLPEFCLTGAKSKATTEQWMDIACLSFDGPEIARMQLWAQRHRVYLGAHGYCLVPEFPGRFFNTAFLISPSGDVVLKAHRIHTGIATSPHDMLAEFLDKIGLEGLFPVAKTPLGNLAILTSTDIAWPEVARANTLRGAEVLVHPASESANLREQLAPVRQARAVENMAYLISCNTARYVSSVGYAGAAGTPAPTAAAPAELPAPSKIIDPDGKIIGIAKDGESLDCRATINVAEVRKRRAAPSGLNFLASLRTETFRDIYGTLSFYPADTWRADIADYNARSGEHVKQAVARMAAMGMVGE